MASPVCEALQCQNDQTLECLLLHVVASLHERLRLELVQQHVCKAFSRSHGSDGYKPTLPSCSETCPMILSLPICPSKKPWTRKQSQHHCFYAVPHLDIFEAFIARPAKSSGQQYQVMLDALIHVFISIHARRLSYIDVY